MWRRLSQAVQRAWRGAAAGPGCSATSAGSHTAAATARQELHQLQQQQRQQLFAWLQTAGVRTGTRHVARHAHPHPRRRALRRAAVATSKATVLAVVGLPAAAAAALVIKGREDAEVVELLRSLPRTARVVWWGLWAGYKVGRRCARCARAQARSQPTCCCPSSWLTAAGCLQPRMRLVSPAAGSHPCFPAKLLSESRPTALLALPSAQTTHKHKHTQNTLVPSPAVQGADLAIRLRHSQPRVPASPG